MAIQIKRDGDRNWRNVGEGNDDGEVSPEELGNLDIADGDMTGDNAQHILIRDGLGAERHLSDIRDGVLRRQSGLRDRGETMVYGRVGGSTETSDNGLGGVEFAGGVTHAFGGSAMTRFMAGAEVGGAFNRNGAFPVGSTTGDARLNGVLLNGLVGARFLVNRALASVDVNFVLGGEIAPNGGQTFEVRTPSNCSGSDSECTPTGNGGQTGLAGVPQTDGPGGHPRLVPGTVGSLRVGGRAVCNFIVASESNDQNSFVIAPYAEVGGRFVLDRYNALVVQGGVILGWLRNRATTTSSSASRLPAQDISADQIGVSDDGHLTFALLRENLPDHSSSEAVRATTTHIAFPIEDGRRPVTASPTIDGEAVTTNLPNNLAEGTTVLVRQGRTTAPFVVTAELAQRFNGEVAHVDGEDVTLSPLGGAAFQNGDTIVQLHDGVPIEGQNITDINPENNSLTIPASRLANGVNGFRIIRGSDDTQTVVQQSRIVPAQSEIAPVSGNYETDIPTNIGDLTGFHVYDGAGHEIPNATLNAANRHLTIPQGFFTGDGPWTVRVSRTPNSQPAYIINFTSPAEVNGSSGINGRDGATYVVQANNPANFILDDPSGTNNLGTIQADRANRNYAVEFIGANGQRVGNRIQLTSAPVATDTVVPLQVTNDQLRTAGIALTPGAYRLRIIATNDRKQARPIDLSINVMNRPFADPTFLHAVSGHRPADAYTYANDAIRVQFSAPTGGFPANTRVALRLVNASSSAVLQHPSMTGVTTGNIAMSAPLTGSSPTIVLTMGRMTPRDHGRGEAGSIVIAEPREARVQWAIVANEGDINNPRLQWRNLDHPAHQGGTIIVGGRGSGVVGTGRHGHGR